MHSRQETIEQRLVRALAHPMRIRILEALTERVASPNRLANEMQLNLSHVAYHTRTLDKYGCLQLVDTVKRRGATEHFYKAVPRSFIGDPQWRLVPRVVRGEVTAASLRSFVEKCVAALTAGTIDARDDTTFTWMPLHLDRRGWKEVTAILREAAELVLAAESRAGARLSADGATGDAIPAIVAFANFETAGSAGG